MTLKFPARRQGICDPCFFLNLSCKLVLFFVSIPMMAIMSTPSKLRRLSVFRFVVLSCCMLSATTSYFVHGYFRRRCLEWKRWIMKLKLVWSYGIIIIAVLESETFLLKRMWSVYENFTLNKITLNYWFLFPAHQWRTLTGEFLVHFGEILNMQILHWPESIKLQVRAAPCDIALLSFLL